MDSAGLLPHQFLRREYNMMEEILNAQQQHWENIFSQKPSMFGDEPSNAAQIAAELFKKEGKTQILELAGGQGRNTIFFAQSGFRVCVIDYCQSGIKAIIQKAQALGLSRQITAKCHDIRKPLPFDNESFDACYSHMLYCMALSTLSLESLSSEIRKILKPEGYHYLTHRKDCQIV